MAPRNKARQQPGSMRSRQQAKLNSQKAAKAPITPAPRTGPRRQLQGSTQGSTRIGNSSQPWGGAQGSNQRVEPVRVRDLGRPQLPQSTTIPESRRLPGMQGPQPASRPQRPGTSRPTAPSRMAAAQARAAQAAQGTRSSAVRIGSPARAKMPPLKGVGKVLGPAAVAYDIYDTGKKVFNPKDNIVTRLSDLGTSIENATTGGRKGTYTNNDRNAKRNAAIKAENLKNGYSDLTTAKNPPSKFAGKRDEAIARARIKQDNSPLAQQQRKNSAGVTNTSTRSSSSTSGGTSSNSTPVRRSSPAPAAPAKEAPFNGSVAEGRKIWADKYSSDKYKGQAIQKEAKAYLEKLKITSSSSDSAPTSKGDAGAGSNAMSSNSKALENNSQAASFNTDKLQKRKGKSYGTARA